MTYELAVAGAFIGVLLKTLLPYLSRQDKEEGWSHRYTLTGILSLLIAVAVALQDVIIALPPGADLGGGMIAGLAVNLVVNKGLDGATKHS